MSKTKIAGLSTGLNSSCREAETLVTGSVHFETLKKMSLLCRAGKREMLRALAKTCPCLGHVVAGGGCLELFPRWRRAKSPQCWFGNSSLNPVYVGLKTWVYTWSPIVPESEGVVRVVWSFNGRILIGSTTFDRLQVPSSGRRRCEIHQTMALIQSMILYIRPSPTHWVPESSGQHLMLGICSQGFTNCWGIPPLPWLWRRVLGPVSCGGILPWGFTIGDVETLAGLFSLILVAKSPPLLIFMVKLPHVC